jgi:oligoendopeptidase F
MVHLTETLLSLPELCLTDELTQRLHDAPDGSAEHLERLWQELAPAYWPDLSSDAVHDHFAVFAWRRQEMLLHNPFTAMSAVIGRLAALDVWCLSRRKPEQAWRQFDKLCTLGSSLPLRQLFTQAGLASPFETGTIKRLAYAACDYLGL